MYESILEKATPSTLEFGNRVEFFEFLDELEENTTWIKADYNNFKLVALDGSSTPEGTLISTTDQWETACRRKEVAVVFKDGEETKTAVLNMFTASLSTNERANAKCKLTCALFGLSSEREEYVHIINKGLEFYKAKAQLLLRGKQIMAIHSNRYNTLSQKTMFEEAFNQMVATFPKCKVIKSSFEHELTRLEVAICDGNGEFMESYAEIWKKTGESPKVLESTYPLILFSTSDTGRYTFATRPVLRIGKSLYPLGSELKMKHNGEANAANIKQNIDLCFAEMKESITKIEKMQSLTLIHPFAAFVRACNKVGITEKFKGLLSQEFESFKELYEDDDSITALTVYRYIVDIQTRTEFAQLAPSTQLQILEGFSRLIQLDWADLDRAGAEAFK